jgi:hypothetical protein
VGARAYRDGPRQQVIWKRALKQASCAWLNCHDFQPTFRLDEAVKSIPQPRASQYSQPHSLAGQQVGACEVCRRMQNTKLDQSQRSIKRSYTTSNARNYYKQRYRWCAYQEKDGLVHGTRLAHQVPRQSDDPRELPTQIAYWSHNKNKSKRMGIACNYITVNTTTHRQRYTA